MVPEEPPVTGFRPLRTPIFAFLCLMLFASASFAQPVPNQYIVELSGTPAAVPLARASWADGVRVLETRRDAIEAQQRDLERILLMFGATPIGAVSTVSNAVLVRVPDQVAQRLAALPGVERVVQAYEMQRTLESALPLLHVPEGWLRIGGSEHAGEGVRIGIIDTGIDQSHPGFVDSSLPTPEGYPKVNYASDAAYTSSKVIVARSYLDLLGESDNSARASDSHGTGVAMAAAGVIQQTESGQISGVAPKAWLGSYNVFPRDGGNTRTDIVLKAFDDAVRDGMNVINLSLGSTFASRPEDDVIDAVFDRAADMGVLVVTSAGNGGPEPFTLGDTGVATSALVVGASWNSRVFAGTVTLSGGQQFPAVPSDGTRPSQPVQAPMRDITEIDPSGLACDTLPADSLTGRIAFILRGVCVFEDKLNFTQAAGAVGAIVYTDEDRPDAITMAVGAATLPASMVSHADGLAIRDRLIASPDLAATIDFRVEARSADPHQLASFSSRGPSTDWTIKPDLVAVGTSLNTARLGSGYSTTQGTSFSSPLVAGAAAVVMSQRPGYPVAQYRSMLVNAATPLVLSSDTPVPVQQAGGGVLNLDAALATTVTASPVSLSFGIDSETWERPLTVFNLGSSPDTFTVSAQTYAGSPPAISHASLSIPAGESQTINVTMAGTGLAPGSYEGMILIQGSQPGSSIHVPYWYAVPSDTPDAIKILSPIESARAGSLQTRAFYVRTTDASGIPLSTPPTVTVVSGGGTVISVFADNLYPGLFAVNIRLGALPGDNVFEAKHGSVTEEVTIKGTSF